MESNMQIIAFYLPQYYSFPENDKWWGEGFTEWTNVKKSKPLYRGHYQPTVPLNENYYCLEDFEVMRWQIKLAKEHGVFGFCFYHYWFGNNRQLMEKPVERFLEHKEVDFPYCLCWANHNWTRTWVGGDKDILMDMQYGDEDEWQKHFDYLLPYFKDERYICVDGNPVLVIYEPEMIPEFHKMRDYLQKCAKEHGLNGITFISQDAGTICEGKTDLVDYCIQYEPNYTSNCLAVSRENQLSRKILNFQFFRDLKARVNRATGRTIFAMYKYDYDAYWDNILRRKVESEKMIAGAFSKVDTSPRRQERGIVFTNASPVKFKSNLIKLFRKVESEYSHNLVFIMAWNEWGEGAYLEPDEKDGYAYLEAIKCALEEYK